MQEISLRRWRRRPDADVVWTLDECAARCWERRRGATAAWLPEPPVGELETAEAEEAREGCVLYGALTTYKGIDRIVRAFTTTPTELPLTLAGYVEPEYRLELDRQIELLKAAGVRLDLRDHIHSEEEGVRVLRGARCVVLPYHRHAGMSRVLLEAAVARTPIVVHDYGLLAHLARTEGIGVTVDADDPGALRTAVTRFGRIPGSRARMPRRSSASRSGTREPPSSRRFAARSRSSPRRSRWFRRTGSGRRTWSARRDD